MLVLLKAGAYEGFEKHRDDPAWDYPLAVYPGPALQNAQNKMDTPKKAAEIEDVTERAGHRGCFTGGPLWL